jgi:3-hydroxybutyryl-CoA dehydratase
MSLDVSVFSRAFDDLWVGETFVTRARTITETDIVSFAALTGDWHPQHADAEWAARGPFGQRIAHGMLVLSYAVGLVPLDPERVVALRRVRDAVFKRPVRLGDTMRVKGRLERLDAVDDDVGIAGWLWTIVNQEDRVVARVEIDVLWRREQAPARATANGSTDGVGVVL